MSEFRLWQAYALIEPFGAYREDVRSAIIAQTVANAQRGRGQRAFKIKDFMPKFGRRTSKPKRQTPDEMVNVLCLAFGAQPPPEFK